MHAVTFRRPRRSALLLSVVLATAGCQSAAEATQPPGGTGAPPSTGTASAGAASAPAPSSPSVAAGGGELSFALEADLTSLDPAICYDSNCIPAVHLLYDTLVTYEPNATVLRPGLAAAMPDVSADGLTYTFTLRDGVSFIKGDGSVLRPVTADDVVFSLNRILDPKLVPYPSPVGPAFFSQIAGGDEVIAGTSKVASGLKVVDASTVSITLTAANRSFLNVLAMTFGSIVPAELAKADATAFSAAPVGTGPFRLASYTKGEKAVFQRNPTYWREGYPRVDTVEFRLGVDPGTQLQQVEAGQLDLMGNDIPAGDFTATTSDPIYGKQVQRASQVATNFLIVDTSGPTKPLTDVRVRQAMAMAIDKAHIVKVNNGRGVVAGCIFPPQLTAFDPACDPYPFDQAKAKALMAEAGYADGFETKLYTDSTDLSKASAEAIIADLATIGIRATLVQQDFDVLIGTMTTPHTAPLGFLGWFQDFPDASDFYDPIFSCASNTPGAANFGWYCNKAADELAAKARGEQDPAVRDGMYRDLQKLVMADVPSIPLYHPQAAYLASSRLVGSPLHPAWIFDLAEVDVAD